MKKLLAILLATALLFSLTACIDFGEIPSEGADSSLSQTESQEAVGSADSSDAPKAEESKTLDLFYDIFSGPYTLKVETYVKDIYNPDNKTVSTTTFTVVDGTKSYTEIISSTSPDTKITRLFMDDYQYVVYDEYKMISRSPIRQSDKGTVMVMQEEEFYADMIGQPETREIFGEKYECERFSAMAETVTYCYDGDELKYIIGDNGGVEVIMGVLELKKGADSSYFELPEDYDKNY